MIHNELRITPEQLALYDELDTRAEAAGLAIIRTNFEQHPNPLNNLDYHNSVHTPTIMRRSKRILQVVRMFAPDVVNLWDIHLGMRAGAFHDTVQKWEAQPVEKDGMTLIRRRRFVGENEGASNVLCAQDMDKVNEEKGKEIYNDDDKARVTVGIDATIPGFDVKRGTVVQPRLVGVTDPVAIALALADIGTAGMEGAHAYKKDGDELFREENLDIKLALLDGRTFSTGEKDFIRTRILDWTKSQIQFAKGRQELLDEELQGLPEKARYGVKLLFSRFPESIHGAEEVTARRMKMNFEELLRDIGYTV